MPHTTLNEEAPSEETVYPTGHIRLTVRGHAGRLLLDRPERGNAWLLEMWREATDAIEKLDADPRVRVILLASAGGSVFSGGADLDQMAQLTTGDDAAAGVDRMLADVEGFISSVERTGKPVVAVIRGAAIGAGLEIAAACDMRIASLDARFGIPAAKHGLVINRLNVARLARVVGWAMASELLLTARTIDAEEALRRGLISAAVADLDAAAEQLIDRIASLSAPSITAMKRHLQSTWPAGEPDDEAFAASRAGLLSADLRASLAARASARRRRV